MSQHRLFGRVIDDAHFCLQKKNSLKAKKGAERFLAVNLEHDHRVCEQRAEDFFDFAQGHQGEPLENIVYQYFQARISGEKSPQFCDQNGNSGNIVWRRAGPSGGESGGGVVDGATATIDKETDLVTILDISGLGLPLRWAYEKLEESHLVPSGLIIFEGSSLYRSLVKETRPSEILKDRRLLHTFLSQVFEDATGQGETIREKALKGRRQNLAGIFEVLSQHRKERHFQPTWVSTWQGLIPHFSREPRGYLHALGMHKDAPSLNILLRYKVKDVEVLARPCQLDAGSNSDHFPTPPCCEKELGGHPMEMDLNLQNRRELISEFIHPQIDYHLRYWEDADRFLQEAEPSERHDLGRLRHKHRSQLNATYQGIALEWMKDSY